MFRKKHSSYPAVSQWSVHHGEQDGKPLFIRRNDSAEQLASHPDYVYRVGIAIPLLEPNQEGLPTSEEMGSLNTIEDQLAGSLEVNQDSIQVLSITSNGMREFVFYSRNPEAVNKILSSIGEDFPQYEFQYYINEDKEWHLYKQFA